MTIQELQTILSFAQVDRNQKVRVFVTSKSGMKEYCNILSYNTFCDGIVLTIESDLLERDGKDEALKDLPRWRKCDKNTIYNTQFNLVENGVGRFLMVEGYQIGIDSLEKLPGFNE